MLTNRVRWGSPTFFVGLGFSKGKGSVLPGTSAKGRCCSRTPFRFTPSPVSIRYFAPVLLVDGGPWYPERSGVVGSGWGLEMSGLYKQ